LRAAKYKRTKPKEKRKAESKKQKMRVKSNERIMKKQKAADLANP
jgi:hypothetical protein